MSAVSARYKQAIARNLAELQRAILNRITLVALEEARVHHLFLKLAYYATFNDYMAHCVKVFETRKQAASFWYVYRTNQAPVDKFIKNRSVKIDELRVVSDKLKHIRDKTHFHIDRTGVLDSKAVWRSADLPGKRLAAAVDTAWAVLSHLQESMDLPKVLIPDYYDKGYVKHLALAVDRLADQ